MPLAFLQELVRGPYSTRARVPVGRVFSVSAGPEFNLDLIWHALKQVIGLTNGDVGFAIKLPGTNAIPADVEFVYEPSPPGGNLAECHRKERGGEMLGCRIVLRYLDGYENGRPIYWPDSVKLLMHEPTHMFFGHVDKRWSDEFGPMIMGGADAFQDQWHPMERVAYLWSRTQASMVVSQALSLSLLGRDSPSSMVSCRG